MPSGTQTQTIETITPLCGVPSLSQLKRFYEVPHFRLGGTYDVGHPSRFEFGGEDGVTLESLGGGPLRTAYIAVGTPQHDSRGRIVNAVLISPYYAGDATWCYYFWHSGQPGNEFSLGPVVGAGRLIDTDRYYVIFADAVGLWGASKPSDGYGLKFPQYSLYDCVQANYRLLKDHLNVARIRLATGVSMGAIQTYLWALLHPGFVEAIMPIGGSTATRTDPVLRWLFNLMSAAMTSDPVWQRTGGDYYHLAKKDHPNRGMMFGWSILMHNAMDLDYRIEQGWDEVQKEVFSWEPQGIEGTLLEEKAANYDVIDLLLRNRAQEHYDIDAHLSSMEMPVLILHVENDLWLRVSLAEQAAQRIPGARFAAFKSPLAHYAVFRAPYVLRREIEQFFHAIEL